MTEEVNNKTVMILAILVVLVVASTSWLVLNKVNSLESSNMSEPPTINVDYSPPAHAGGQVGFTILPQPEGGGE